MKTTSALLCLFFASTIHSHIVAAADNKAATHLPAMSIDFTDRGIDYDGYLSGGRYVSRVSDKVVDKIITGGIDPIGGNSALAQKVRDANDKFKDLAAAVAAGYIAMPCASGATGGAMGIHYVNVDYLKDAKPDIARPQAIMYEPAEDGKMQLVAVEYISFKGPVDLDGQLFQLTPAPNRYGLDNFYELHVWAWKDNPAGEFADNNTKVSCKFAKSAMK